MAHTLDGLRAPDNSLASHYLQFGVADKLLLTGHSHQAWPDVSFSGQKQAWIDAAKHADGKWALVQDKVDRVSAGFRAWLGECTGDIVLAPNTHDLVIRFLSSLPLREKPRIIATDGEFHSIRRQIDRLALEGIQVIKVPASPIATLAERLAAEVDGNTACAMISSVLFESGRIVPGLAAAADACKKHGADLLVDSYHSLGVVPFSMAGLEGAFVVGGGYKYLQLGEGNCFLRVPPGCTKRPVITGWFAEFSQLASERKPGEVLYSDGPARFAGSTFDPTSAYRAASVMDFFDQQGLAPDFLRSVSQHQVGLLHDTFMSLDIDPKTIALQTECPMEQRAGFLALEVRGAPGANDLSEALLKRGVRTDSRGSVLRFGPAPYLSDAQLRDAMGHLGECLAVKK